MSSLGKTILVGLLTAIGALSVGVPPVRGAATSPPDPAVQVRKRILIFYDENKDDLPGLARTDRSLRESVRAELGNAVEIHSESMGLSRSARAGYDSLLADFSRGPFLLVHGGRIWATANSGRGLTVHIELPCLSHSPNDSGTAAEVA